MPLKTIVPSRTLQVVFAFASAAACLVASSCGVILARAIGFSTRPFQPVRSFPLNIGTKPSPCGIAFK